MEVLIVHPGGPLWSKKDEGAWSIPKGEFREQEDPEAVARREFTEELGLPVPDGDLVSLGDYKQPGGKVVTCLAMAANLDVKDFKSNNFEMEWPPRSGRVGLFPEIDLARWFDVGVAKRRLLVGQRPIVDALQARLV